MSQAAAEKYMPQLQHNMWVVAARSAVLSIITGGGKWVEITTPCRSALSAPDCHGRTQVLALRREWRAPSPLWSRIPEAPDRMITSRTKTAPLENGLISLLIRCSGFHHKKCRANHAFCSENSMGSTMEDGRPNRSAFVPRRRLYSPRHACPYSCSFSPVPSCSLRRA
jgi:hypothetical protein